MNRTVSSTWPLGLQYFFYFGVMGIYLPYFNLYCYHLDFTGFEIGLLSAVRTLCMVVFSLVWGIIADRFSVRKPIYVLCNVLSALIWALYLWTDEFVPMMLITVMYALFYGPIIAFLEALTMDTLGRQGHREKYGNIRVWGSLNFIAVVMILGWLIDSLPIKTIVVMVLVGSMLQAVFSLTISEFREESESRIFYSHIKEFITLRTAMFLVSSFLMLASHGTYYAFFSIYLEQLHFDRAFIGFAWGLASMAEIVVMIKSDMIFKRFSLRSVFVISFAVAALRWMILFFAVSPGLILFAQILHAMTYGAFHVSCILFIDELSSEEAKTFGQVTNNAVSYGLGMMAGFVFNGYFFELYGKYLYISSAFLAVLGGMIFMLSEFRNRERDS